MSRSASLLAAIGLLVALSSCQQPTDADNGLPATLKIENNTGQTIVGHFGDYLTKAETGPATSSIAPGASRDYLGAPVGADFNIWYTYSDGTTNWTVRLTDEASATYVFRFSQGLSYRLVLNGDSFEYYQGSTPIVLPPSEGTVDAPLIAASDGSNAAVADGGSGTAPMKITMSSTTAGASIRYTSNGSDPTAYSTLYSAGSPPSFGASATIKAQAFLSGMSASPVTTFSFTVLQQVATPLISAVDGAEAPVNSSIKQWDAISASISCSTPGAEIRYTTDGSDPLASSPLYSSALTISAPTTLKAAAFKSGMIESSTASASYEVYPPQVAGLGKIAAMTRTTGSLLYAVDNASAKLFKIDAAAETVELAANLPYANPTDIEYSAEDGLLYISYRYQGKLSRYDPSASSFLGELVFSSSAGSTAGLDLEISDVSDRIFVLVPPAGSFSYDGRVAILDKAGAVKRVPGTTDLSDANLMALSPDGSLLFLAARGLSSSNALHRYSTAGDALTLQAGALGSANGESLAVAPDGSSLIYLCGGGNAEVTPSYQIADFAPSNFAAQGAWNLGAYPSVGAFSADSQFFYATKDHPTKSKTGILRVYGRSDYQLKRDLEIPFFWEDSLIEATANNGAVVVYSDDTYTNPVSKQRFWFLTEVR